MGDGLFAKTEQDMTVWPASFLGNMTEVRVEQRRGSGLGFRVNVYDYGVADYSERLQKAEEGCDVIYHLHSLLPLWTDITMSRQTMWMPDRFDIRA